MKKELLIFVLLFFVLALSVHMRQWIEHPLTHLHNLATNKNPYHPLLFTFIIYLFIGIVRSIVYGIKKLFKRRHDSF